MIIDTENYEGQKFLTEVFLAGQWVGVGTGYSKAMIDHGVPQFISNLTGEQQAELIKEPLGVDDVDNERLLKSIITLWEDHPDDQEPTRFYHLAYSEKPFTPLADVERWPEHAEADRSPEDLIAQVMGLLQAGGFHEEEDALTSLDEEEAAQFDAEMEDFRKEEGLDA